MTLKEQTETLNRQQTKKNRIEEDEEQSPSWAHAAITPSNNYTLKASRRQCEEDATGESIHNCDNCVPCAREPL